MFNLPHPAIFREALRNNKTQRRRSLYIAEDVRAGEPLTPKNLRTVRPGYGLPPKYYEILLGRRLHKASFRRALQAAYLVEPTDEWRSEGRGRPAQLFTFAPRKRRASQGSRRAVRFDLLAG